MIWQVPRESPRSDRWRRVRALCRCWPAVSAAAGLTGGDHKNFMESISIMEIPSYSCILHGCPLSPLRRVFFCRRVFFVVLLARFCGGGQGSSRLRRQRPRPGLSSALPCFRGLDPRRHIAQDEPLSRADSILQRHSSRHAYFWPGRAPTHGRPRGHRSRSRNRSSPTLAACDDG